MLGEKMDKNKVNIWLINTGWSGGSYGVGSRMKLSYTRAMITTALEGKLDNVSYTEHEVFGVQMPDSCENVPTEILHPKNTWSDKSAYDETANQLAAKFIANFEKFASDANQEILNAAPKVNATA